MRIGLVFFIAAAAQDEATEPTCEGPCWVISPTTGLCVLNFNDINFQTNCIAIKRCTPEKLTFQFQSILFGETSAYSATTRHDTSITFESGVDHDAYYSNTALGWTYERVNREDIDYIAVTLKLGNGSPETPAEENSDLGIYFTNLEGVHLNLDCLFTARAEIDSASATVVGGGAKLSNLQATFDLGSILEIKYLSDSDMEDPDKYIKEDLGSETISTGLGSRIHAGIQFTEDGNFGAFAVSCSVIAGDNSFMVLKEQCAADATDTTFDYMLFSPRLCQKRSILSYRSFSWNEYTSTQFKIQCSLEFCFLGNDCNNRKSEGIRTSPTTSMNSITCTDADPYKYQYDNSFGDYSPEACLSFTMSAADQLLTFSEAEETCASQGGRLAFFRSEDEFNSFLSQVSLVSRTGAMWIGSHDKREEGNFENIDGTAMSFFKWLDGEPNDNQNEDCVEFHWDPAEIHWDSDESGFGFNDRDCSLKHRYACRFE